MGLAALAMAAAGCQRGEETIASVNGTPVNKEEFFEYLLRKPTIRVQTGNGAATAQVAGSIGLQALNDTVNRNLLLQMAKEEGVYPTEADVKAEIEFREKQDKGFVNKLTGQGLTLKSIREDIRIELARFRLITKGVTVTDAEIDKYIADNPREFIEPERADLRWIFVPSDELRDQAQGELDKGQLFTTVASTYSTAQGARQNSGRFPVSNIDQLDQAFPGLTKIVRGLKERQSTDWIQANAGYAKFYVERKVPERKIQMNETRREQVKRFIMLRRGSAANDLEDRLTQRLKQAKVTIADSELKKQWDKAIDELVQSDRDEQGRGGLRSTLPGGADSPTSRGTEPTDE